MPAKVIIILHWQHRRMSFMLWILNVVWRHRTCIFRKGSTSVSVSWWRTENHGFISYWCARKSKRKRSSWPVSQGIQHPTLLSFYLTMQWNCLAVDILKFGCVWIKFGVRISVEVLKICRFEKIEVQWSRQPLRPHACQKHQLCDICMYRTSISLLVTLCNHKFASKPWWGTIDTDTNDKPISKL
jgi:hypothetical protein